MVVRYFTWLVHWASLVVEFAHVDMMGLFWLGSFTFSQVGTLANSTTNNVFLLIWITFFFFFVCLYIYKEQYQFI